MRPEGAWHHPGAWFHGHLVPSLRRIGRTSACLQAKGDSRFRRLSAKPALSGSVRAFVDWVSELFEHASLLAREVHNEVPLCSDESVPSTRANSFAHAVSDTAEAPDNPTAVHAL